MKLSWQKHPQYHQLPAIVKYLSVSKYIHHIPSYQKSNKLYILEYLSATCKIKCRNTQWQYDREINCASPVAQFDPEDRIEIYGLSQNNFAYKIENYICP
ncbi:hypothetical protein T05_14462 [Trichinella murrelli]|uniref:Uncharacterized protein n=1 Tax=Trichinella murrelli TaxID=144512 RepID=A0A0V0T256_9BILA|nr:hypothetical protein T05_14462 [Trichinella murrelli]